MKTKGHALYLFAITLAIFVVTGCHTLSRPSLAPYRHVLARPAEPGAGLVVRFLGTSSIVFDDGRDTLLIDGFFSRPSPRALLLERLRPNQGRIDAAFRRADIRRVSAVLVAHTHHDHAMDAPCIAMRTGALILGSRSMANIASGAGVGPDQMHILGDRENVRIGRFEITAFETPHSPRSLLGGPIREPLAQPARLAGYRGGSNFSFLVQNGSDRILVVPSANSRPGAFDRVRADVVFLSIGTLGKQSAAFIGTYWQRTVLASGARLVIPIHWDDFTRSLARPLVPMRRGMDDFERGLDSILVLARRDGVAVRLPEAFTPIDLHQQ